MTNEEYIRKADINQIPWNQLTGPYERSGEMPGWIAALNTGSQSTADEAQSNIAMNFEHQNTLWANTPFTMLFLRKQLVHIMGRGVASEDSNAKKGILRILELFHIIYYNLEADIWSDDLDTPLAQFEDMLLPEYLLEDIAANEDDEDTLIELYSNLDETLFYSFFYYSWYILRYSIKNDFLNSL